MLAKETDAQPGSSPGMAVPSIVSHNLFLGETDPTQNQSSLNTASMSQLSSTTKPW
jgi:hypothetical protein